jgi:hypothetical protein
MTGIILPGAARRGRREREGLLLHFVVTVSESRHTILAPVLAPPVLLLKTQRVPAGLPLSSFFLSLSPSSPLSSETDRDGGLGPRCDRDGAVRAAHTGPSVPAPRARPRRGLRHHAHQRHRHPRPRGPLLRHHRHLTRRHRGPHIRRLKPKAFHHQASSLPPSSSVLQ